MWVRFTGSNVATNKSLNVRFENGAGALVANTINLFSFGLQRNLLNVWQLVVIPITSFGVLPTSVKGLKIIMTGGTVGQARQWDIDYMILTNGSVPQANVPTIVFAKDGTNIASQSGINLIEGTGVTINAVNNPTLNRVDYTINALQKMQIALTDRSNNIVASTIVHEFIVLENFEITSSPFISLVTAPTGANFILQIQKNGVEVGINTKALVVTAGTNVSTATTDFNGVTFAKGDRISFRVTQIGSVNAGKGLDILLNFKN